MENELIRLPETFRLYGFVYTQVSRTETTAIYRQTLAGNDHVFFYEVWRIRVVQPREVMGKPYPAREVRPGNEDWGTYGFTVYRLADAENRQDQLLSGQLVQKQATA